MLMWQHWFDRCTAIYDPHYTLSIPREAEVFGLHIHLHNSHFTDPVFELGRNECEIGHYNTYSTKS